MRGRERMEYNKLLLLIFPTLKSLSSEYLKSDDKFNEWINTDSHLSHIDYWVAHNINVEKSIIKKYTPYKTFNEITGVSWGPWIDTLKIYKNLYPKLADYSLANLGFVFLQEKEIDHLAKKLCVRTKNKYHQSMYDCVSNISALEENK